ncbi:MAG: tetratricopeptide repeat protein [Planctomycetota bacterium]
MKNSARLLPLLALLWSASGPAIAQDSHAPPHPAHPATATQGALQLPDIGKTDRMDPEVVALIHSMEGKVREAEATGDLQAVGNAVAELGLAYEANTMWTPASACYATAYALLPEGARFRDAWLYRRGACEHALGNVELAVELLGKAAPLLTGTAVVQARHAQALYDLGDLQGAEAAWRAAIGSELISWNKADENARPAKPVSIPASRVGLAQILWEQDRIEEAEALLREALSLEGNYPHAYYLLGQILADQGRMEEAEFALARGKGAYPVLPPDPHGALLASMRAGYGNRMRNIEIAMQEGRMPEAVAELDKMLVERPADHLVLNLAARAQMMSGQLGKALDFLQRSETADPTEYQTKIELTILYLNLAGAQQVPANRAEMLEKARVKSEEAVQLAPLLGSPYYYRGLVELSSIAPDDPQGPQRMQAALNLMQHAQLLGCQDPQLYEQLAMLYARTGKLDAMLAFAQEGAQKSPENPGAWMFLARAYFSMNNGEKALQAANRAVTVSKNDPQVLAFLEQLRQAVQQAK